MPDQAYADRDFWQGATNFRVPRSVPQTGPSRRVNDTARPARKDVVAQLGSGAVVGAGGVIAFEAKIALANTRDAWTNPAQDDRSSAWTHTHAPSSEGDGLAMHVRPRGLRWDDPHTAPGMHFALTVVESGRYRVWLLVKFDDNHDDSCVIAVDGIPQPAREQHSRGDLCAYGLRQRWIWVHLSDISLTAGDHTVSVLARKSGLRVDRAYLTLGDELPPVDADWVRSARREN